MVPGDNGSGYENENNANSLQLLQQFFRKEWRFAPLPHIRNIFGIKLNLHDIS